MKTLEEIKNDVCLEYGYYTYSIAVSDFKQGRMGTKTFNCIVRDIAREVAKEALKNASENARLTISEFRKSKDNSIGWNEVTLKENLYIINDGCNIVANKQSILNESNIPKI